jgi:hypothetical protein
MGLGFVVKVSSDFSLDFAIRNRFLQKHSFTIENAQGENMPLGLFNPAASFNSLFWKAGIITKF